MDTGLSNGSTRWRYQRPVKVIISSVTLSFLRKSILARSGGANKSKIS